MSVPALGVRLVVVGCLLSLPFVFPLLFLRLNTLSQLRPYSSALIAIGLGALPLPFMLSTHLCLRPAPA